MDKVNTELAAVRNDQTEIAIPLQTLSFPTTYIQAATSANTRKAYQADVLHFIAWGGVLPTTPDIIIRYLHDYADTLNPRTLSRRLTALKQWHVYQHFPDPTQHPLIQKTLTGIHNVHGRPKEKAPAMTLEQLTMLVQHLKRQNTLQALRNSALLQVGFFGAFRRSELAAIQYEHVNFTLEGITILIPRSKGDQRGEGQTCAIPYGDEILCAATALKTWCEKAALQSGYLFPAINRHQQLNQKPLTTDAISWIIKNLAIECQLPQAEKFSAHSLRRGFATATSQCGASFVSILRHGRWKHEKTVLGYIEEGQQFIDNAATHLFKQKQTTATIKNE